jgi:hypothetical protein
VCGRVTEYPEPRGPCALREGEPQTFRSLGFVADVILFDTWQASRKNLRFFARLGLAWGTRLKTVPWRDPSADRPPAVAVWCDESSTIASSHGISFLRRAPGRRQ